MHVLKKKVLPYLIMKTCKTHIPLCFVT